MLLSIQRLLNFLKTCNPDIKLIQLIKGELSAKDKTVIPKKAKTTKRILSLKSQYALADCVIEGNEIIFVPQMAAFMVKGSRGEKYSVLLFPKEKCSCPATNLCYHIIAAMKSIGMDIPGEKKVFNLTQLRRNCRPKE